MEGNHIPPMFDSEPPPFDDDDDFGDFVTQSDNGFGSGNIEPNCSIKTNDVDYFGGGNFKSDDLSWNAFGTANDTEDCNGFGAFNNVDFDKSISTSQSIEKSVENDVDKIISSPSKVTDKIGETQPGLNTNKERKDSPSILQQTDAYDDRIATLNKITDEANMATQLVTNDIQNDAAFNINDNLMPTSPLSSSKEEAGSVHTTEQKNNEMKQLGNLADSVTLDNIIEPSSGMKTIGLTNTENSYCSVDEDNAGDNEFGDFGDFSAGTFTNDGISVSPEEKKVLQEGGSFTTSGSEMQENMITVNKNKDGVLDKEHHDCVVGNDNEAMEMNKDLTPNEFVNEGSDSSEITIESHLQENKLDNQELFGKSQIPVDEDDFGDFENFASDTDQTNDITDFSSVVPIFKSVDQSTDSNHITNELRISSNSLTKEADSISKTENHVDCDWGDFGVSKNENEREFQTSNEIVYETNDDKTIKISPENPDDEFGDFGNALENANINDNFQAPNNFELDTRIDDGISTVAPENTDFKSATESKPECQVVNKMSTATSNDDDDFDDFESANECKTETWGDFGDIQANQKADDSWRTGDIDAKKITVDSQLSDNNQECEKSISNEQSQDFDDDDFGDFNNFESAGEIKSPLENQSGDDWGNFGNIQTSNYGSDKQESENEFKLQSNTIDSSAASTTRGGGIKDKSKFDVDDDWGDFDSTSPTQPFSDSKTVDQIESSVSRPTTQSDFQNDQFSKLQQEQKISTTILSISGALEAINVSFTSNGESIEVNAHLLSVPLGHYVAVVNESSVKCFASFLKEAEDDDSSEMVRFDRSSICGSMMETFGLDANALDNNSPFLALSPSLSASIESWEKIETEPSILVPDKPTLLHQSLSKEEMLLLGAGKNALKRNPSLSSLKRDGGSGSASETASLDLDFFTGGVTTQISDASTAPVIDSDLFGIDLNDTSSIPQNNSDTMPQKKISSEIDNIVRDTLLRDSKTTGVNVKGLIPTQGNNVNELTTVASSFLDSIEDISYMNANVLMFPTTLLPTDGDL